MKTWKYSLCEFSNSQSWTAAKITKKLSVCPEIENIMYLYLSRQVCGSIAGSWCCKSVIKSFYTLQ